MKERLKECASIVALNKCQQNLEGVSNTLYFLHFLQIGKHKHSFNILGK